MKKILKNKITLLIPLFFICVSIFSTSLLALSTEWAINDKSKVRLISSKTTSDNMDELIIGLEYKLEPGWKTYWKSPGGGGFPQSIEWNNSTNVDELNLEWPKPKEFQILGLTSIGYENNVIFPLIVKLKNKNKITKINLNINYLVCKHVCIPGNANLILELPDGEGEYTPFFHTIEKIRSTLPSSDINLTEINNISTEVFKGSKNIEISITAESNKNFINPKIFIHTPFGLPVKQPLNEYSFNLKKINSKFKFNKDQFSKENFPIEVLIFDKNHNFIFNKNISIEKKLSNINLDKSIYYIILISLIGGFILNLMPCVFPVLSIKLISVLNNKSENVRLSFIYTTIGIIFSFLLLAIFFTILKELQISIAWGMQFQEPYFLLFILLVLTIFSLNTLELFEIDLPTSIKSSNIFSIGNSFFAKNFFNGFFATLLATPCSAPFIGTAITLAFTQSSAILFLIFISMGAGMSIPYIIVMIFPKVVNLLPKRGKWTIYTKYFLSALLIGTIIWIINVLLSFYNLYFLYIFLLILIFFIVSIKFSFFKYPIAIFFISFVFSVPSINFFAQNNTNTDLGNWKNFSNIVISDLIEGDKIVFIDITADWCATCQFNKLNVLQSKSIKDAFDINQIILVRADWTKPSKNIDDFLKKYNRFGIPFNAFFSTKYPNGLLLSEILSEKEILNSIDEIK